MKILIVGRTGSGKSHFANLLKQKGFKVAKSYTTRPKRTEDESTYQFITEKEAAKITNKIAPTTHNGYQYFLTQEEIDKSDAIIVDPKGVRDITNKSDTAYHVIYITADENIRKEHAINRADNKEEAENIFNKQSVNENDMFLEFENIITNKNAVDNPYHNISEGLIIENTHENNIFDKYINEITDALNLHKTVESIVQMCANEGVIDTTKNKNEIIIYEKLKGAEVESTITIDQLSELLLRNQNLMGRFIMHWLLHITHICPDIVDAIYSYINNTETKSDTPNIAEIPD